MNNNYDITMIYDSNTSKIKISVIAFQASLFTISFTEVFNT